MTNQSSGKNIISPNTLDQKSLNIQGPAYIAKIQKTAVFLLIFTSIINGLGVVSMSMALQYTTPVYFIALRFLLGALVLIAVFHKKLLKSSKETIKAGAILGIFIITSVSIQSISLQYTTAGKASFISSLYVVLVAIFSWVSSRKINFLQIGMVLLTIIGLAVFSLEKDMAANKGDLLNIITAFIYSGHFIFLSHFAQKHELMTLVTWQVIFSAIGSLLVAMLLEPNPLPFDLRLWPLALFSGIVATAISYLFQGWGQRIIPPMQTSVIFSSMGIFTALFDWLFLDIVFTKQQYLGAVIIISCTLLVAVMPTLEWKKKKIHKIRPYINK